MGRLNLDLLRTPVTRKQHFRPTAERLWNAHAFYLQANPARPNALTAGRASSIARHASPMVGRRVVSATRCSERVSRADPCRRAICVRERLSVKGETPRNAFGTPLERTCVLCTAIGSCWDIQSSPARAELERLWNAVPLGWRRVYWFAGNRGRRRHAGGSASPFASALEQAPDRMRISGARSGGVCRQEPHASPITTLKGGPDSRTENMGMALCQTTNAHMVRV